MTDENAASQVMMNRRRMLSSIGLAGAASLAGCVSGGGGGGGSGGGKLNFGQSKGPIEFDPIVLNDVPSAEVAAQVFEGLYTYDEQTGIVPELADGQPEVGSKGSGAADGTRYTVALKDAATFQNGDSVTAEDVKYSFEAPVDEETENASSFNMIESISVMDETTVQFDLKYPYGAFRHTLTASVVPKSVREEDKEAFNTESPVGSGQFEFDDWQEGQFARVTRWDDYWGEPVANVAEVEFSPVEESTTRITTLNNGENHIVKGIPPKQYSTVEGMEGASVQEVPGIGYFYLAMNCMEGPTTDKTVREAIDYTFSMDDAVSNYVEPTGIRQYSPLPASIADTWDMPTDEWESIPHDKDIEQAQQLFEEAGVPMDYSWNIIVPPDDKREQIGITVSNGLKEAGFDDVTVQRLDWGAFLDKYVTGSEDDYNMYTLGWAGTPDPDAFTYYLFGRTDDTLGVTNGTYYGNNSESGKEAAEKFVQARESADREERKRLYEEGITTVLEDRAHIPAYNLKNSFGVRDSVSDFLAHPADQFHLVTDHNNVSLDE
ncbi:MAG: ABC transporter substrate-binding protein [Halolamina sp.]